MPYIRSWVLTLFWKSGRLATCHEWHALAHFILQFKMCRSGLGSCRWDPVPLLALCILRHLRENNVHMTVLPSPCNVDSAMLRSKANTPDDAIWHHIKQYCITMSCHFFAPHSLWSLEFVLQMFPAYQHIWQASLHIPASSCLRWLHHIALIFG